MPPRRSARITGANINDNPNNNAARLAELLTQITANLNVGRANNGEGSLNTRRGCSYKTFMASNPKDFYGNVGAVGLIKVGVEFWNHQILGTEVDKYTARFHELAKISSRVPKRNDNERKRQNDQSRKQDQNQQNKRRQVTRNYGLATHEQRPYNGPQPKCTKCNLHHVGDFPRCNNCGQTGHFAKGKGGSAEPDCGDGAAPVAKAPYHLALPEMQELFAQLQELLSKGLIRLSLSSREHNKAGHEQYLNTILSLLKDEKLYAKFFKCEFWLREVQFIGHVFNAKGIYVDPTKIEAIKKWEALRTPTKICQFLEIKEENLKEEALSGAIEKLETIVYGIKFLNRRAWIRKVNNLRKVVMDEAHRSRYSIHPRADKMYMDVKKYYWWPGMKRDIAIYVRKCFTCAKVKENHQNPSGLL
nr:putative reverse transcriptase domain-containing protein [Tanacetum cinerariifolium]